MEMVLVVSFLSVLATGLVLVLAQEKTKVQELESKLAMDSAIKMERILGLESHLRLEKDKVQELAQELKWVKARAMALELDLERAQAKLMWKE